jgi:hypothetical protein
MTTAQEFQDAMVSAIEGAVHETLPLAMAPEVVCINDPEIAVGKVQILIRVGMGLPSSEPALGESAQPVAALHSATNAKSPVHR